MAQHLTASLWRFPHLEPLIGKSIELSDGTTIDVEEHVGNSENFDVSLWPITKYLSGRELGLKAIALPVFPVRRFVQWMIEVPEASDIESVKDLEGKRIGQIDWGHTCAVDSRGVLEDAYGLDLSGVKWFTSRKEQVEGQEAPAGVTRLDNGNLNDLLLAGEIDAALGNGYGDEPAAGIRRLFADPETEAASSYKTLPFFPIIHLVVVSEAATPYGQEIYELFVNAKNEALEEFANGATLPEEKKLDALQSGFPGSGWGGADRAFLGRDPIPYGVEANRDAFQRTIDYSFTQGAIKQSQAVEELLLDLEG